MIGRLVIRPFFKSVVSRCKPLCRDFFFFPLVSEVKGVQKKKIVIISLRNRFFFNPNKKICSKPRDPRNNPRYQH